MGLKFARVSTRVPSYHKAYSIKPKQFMSSLVGRYGPYGGISPTTHYLKTLTYKSAK